MLSCAVLGATVLLGHVAAKELTTEEIAAAYPNPIALPPASELNYRKYGVDASQTLREAAKAAGIYVGAATNYNYLTTGAEKETYR